MSKKFVRTITGTKLRGKNAEPLKTNLQNDLLSDDEDVFVRNKNEYHALTDNIKTISVPPENDLIEVRKTGKNSVRLVAKETEVTSLDERLIINKKTDSGLNEFEVTLDLPEIDEKSSLKYKAGDIFTYINTTEDKIKVEFKIHLDVDDELTKNEIDTIRLDVYYGSYETNGVMNSAGKNITINESDYTIEYGLLTIEKTIEIDLDTTEIPAKKTFTNGYSRFFVSDIHGNLLVEELALQNIVHNDSLI